MTDSVFHIMAKPSSFQCNMSCNYCFYLEKETIYGKQMPMRMDDATLRQYIKQQVKAQANLPEIGFVWQGGEPTICGLDFFKTIVKYQKRYSNGKPVNNSIQTNGLLIDDKWARFLAENRFLVGISIDGPEHLHDRYRVSKGRTPTFKKVMAAIERMKKYKVDFNTLTVINDHNCDHGLEVYRFLKSIGSDFHQYIPIVELMESDARIDDQAAQLIFPVKRENNKMTSFSVPGSSEEKGYGKFMTEVFDEWVKNDVGDIYVRLFETVLAQTLGYPPSICIFQKTCGNALVLEQNGDLYPCDHFVYEDLKLGNINDEYVIDMAKSDKQKAFGDSKETTLTDICRSCEFLNLCNGGCPKHRVVEVGEKYQQNHLCGSYKKIFSHMKPYMEYMANELRHQRAPQTVKSFTPSAQ
ncbi:anaerobic sulfatase maturase [Endozoicomonas atrinae]|uniref:anaerobic sulfatase maturase n=1 Tax=Endozoicomonas atrinae TaxID=1333660 RepID=UPI000A8AFEBB|nr:anaerobic sulfatase maturase [Endozoicomonas atrinae]